MTSKSSASQNLLRPLAVLVSPRATFESLRESRSWGWVVALLLVVGTGLLFGELIYPKLDIEDYARAQLEKSSQNLSDADLDRIVSMQKDFGRIFYVWLPTGLMLPLGCLLAGLFLWLGLKVSGGDLGYADALSTFLHSLMPLALAALLMIPVGLAQSRISVEKLQSQGVLATNLAWLAPKGTAPTVKAALASVDLFSIWVVFLLVVGSAIVAGVSRRSAAIVVVGLWLFWILVKVALTGLGS